MTWREAIAWTLKSSVSWAEMMIWAESFLSKVASILTTGGVIM